MDDIHTDSTPRITTQRQAIFQLVQKSRHHFTVDQVYQEVKKTLPRVSLATVYRNLDALAEGNLLGKTSINGLTYFEAEMQPHYHVVCLSCQQVENLPINPATDIEEFFGRQTAFRLTGHDLTMYGVCPRCQKKR